MEDKDKKFPVYRNQSIFVYIVALLIAFVLGRQVFLDAGSVFSDAIWGYAIGTFVGGYVFLVLIYEIGKLIFGKLANYRLVKLNLFGLTFTKEKDGTKVRLSKFEGFGGKTIMAPKSEKANPYLYLLGGTIFTTIIVAGFIVSSLFICKDRLDLEPILYISYLVGIIAVLYLILNLAPVLNDDMYDGFIIRLIASSNCSKAIYHHLLLQEEAFLTGKNELQVLECDYHNPINAKILLYNCFYYFDNDESNRVKEIIKLAKEYEDYIMEDELALFYSFEYYYLLSDGGSEKITDAYWGLEKSTRKVVNGTKRFDTLKTALMVAAFIELSYDSYEYITMQIDKLKKSYSPLRREKEDELVERALKIIENKKPEWFKAYENNDE